MYDLVIIGGGPGAVAAGVYAARKKMRVLLIAQEFGGQSLVSSDIQNWIGTKSVSGLELAKMFEEHLRAQEDIEIIDSDLVNKVSKRDEGFLVETENGKSVETKTVLVVSGSRRKRLGIPGEDKLDGRGVVFCSTCDAPLFKDKIVAIVGGGNAGVEAVLDSIPYASKIYLIVRSIIKADLVTQEKIKKSSKLEIILNAEIQEILGDDFVTGLRYKNKEFREVKELKLDGVFVEIGSIPNSDFVKSLVNTNEIGEIIVDHKNQASSFEGIWAAGDVSDVLYKQNNISAGDSIKAVLNIYSYLHRK